jgi:hypothetical protein
MAEKNGIIDLTDEVVDASPEDDTIIDLTAAVSPDDDIIELTDAIDDGEAEALDIDLVDEAPAEDHDAVDLVEEIPDVDVPTPDAEETAVDPFADVEAEDIAEAAAEAAPADTPSSGVFDIADIEAGSDAVDATVEADTQIPEAPESSEASSESDLGDVVYFDDSVEDDLEESPQDDFVESLGMAIDETYEDEDDTEETMAETTAGEAELDADGAAPEMAAAPALDIPEDQLAAAIENAVEKAVSGKVEAILVQVVEKAVGQEIARIKKAIMDEMTDD